MPAMETIEHGAESKVHLYESVAGRMADLIARGTFPSGARVPSVRSLSRQWEVSITTVLEAYRLLYRATGDRTALAHAESIADATLAAFRGRWKTEPAQFAAIFFRRLLALAAVDGRSDYVGSAQAYADRLWRSPRRQLFQQAAVVQVYAALVAARGAA